VGIYSITEAAMAGLNIAQAGILTTSQNVAGTSIEGYSRRNANVIMDSLAPNSLMHNGSSFAVGGFTRQYSSLLNGQLLNQQAKSSYSETLVQYTKAIDSLVADKSTGLNTAIGNFFNAVGAYAADPTNKAMAGAITGTANAVAQRMAGMSNLTTQLQSDARKGLVDTVAQANTLLPALASINQKIVEATSPGNSAPSADLLDERDRLLSQLQKLVGGQSLINSDETATQLVAGMPLVERAIANKITINADFEHVALTFNLQNGPGRGVQTTVQNLDSGQAGALLKIANEFVPSITRQLDTIALGLVKVANSAAQTTLGTATNLAIFGFKVGEATYSSLADPDPTSDIPEITSDASMTAIYDSLASPANPMTASGLKASNFISRAPSDFLQYLTGAVDGGDPLITSAKANTLQQLSTVFASSASNFVNDVGVQVATWKSNQKADSVVLATLKNQRDSISGVSLDEEAANLLKYQQMYTASTKVLQAGNQMFNTLLSIMN
jgi:flagellar hook-associated protein 1 FlgK